MSDLTWTLNLQIKDGPRLSLGDSSAPLDGYDRVDKNVPCDGTPVRLDLQPADEPGVLRLLVIMRSPQTPSTDQTKPKPKPDPEKLTYQVNGTGDWIPLDMQQVYLGYGAFKQFKNVPTWLSVNNQQAEDTIITVLVGREMKLTQQGGGGGGGGGGGSGGGGNQQGGSSQQSGGGQQSSNQQNTSSQVNTTNQQNTAGQSGGQNTNQTSY